ncbi:MerR family transcriptional regulator [Streptococcus suis]|uniref:MerR family transcriptional regulator n=1 Tax=Streptococcus suis TaxID=1307 RepID=UPI000CF5B830|nr:MerR family transcriptional regulator [Streptococcus suis]HEM2808967.1 MerR family transcriptional regulator [Streptococcus suis]HEM6204325.1 MerR family transcriptional regulator [Streptococcus suis]HEP1844901.1 MerR family transcriptional regulator [Streptococcus suis]
MLTIKEVAKQTGLSAHTIRYYEKEGLVKIPRDKNGIRIFNDESIEILNSIAHYRKVGMPLENIRQIINEFTNHKLSTALLKNVQKELELEIMELQAVQDYLEEKIKIHEFLASLQSQGVPSEERIKRYFEIKNNGGL